MAEEMTSGRGRPTGGGWEIVQPASTAPERCGSVPASKPVHRYPGIRQGPRTGAKAVIGRLARDDRDDHAAVMAWRGGARAPAG